MKVLEKLFETFCNGRKPIRIKRTPVTVLRGQFFVRGDVDYDKLKRLAEEHNAKVVEEYSETEELLGYAIVPNVGFNGRTMESWFKEEGISLLKRLVSEFRR